MIILVDAYNLLKSILEKSVVSFKEKADFIEMMGRYAKVKRHEIILVFDGGEGGLLDKEMKRDCLVIHTGANQTADDFIIAYVKKHEKSKFFIITSDRALQNAIEKMGIFVLSSSAFYYKISDVFQVNIKQQYLKKQEIKKMHNEIGIESAFVDQYMYGIKNVQKNEENSESRIKKSKEFKKKIREKMQKIRKL